jgi:uncharacterized protein
MRNAEITKSKLDKYFKLTETALKMAKIKKSLSSEDKQKCEQFIDFCERYLSDAKHFKEKGDWVTAFAALNYAHAWLDASAIAGWLDIKHKDRNKYFTVD